MITLQYFYSVVEKMKIVNALLFVSIGNSLCGMESQPGFPLFGDEPFIFDIELRQENEREVSEQPIQEAMLMQELQHEVKATEIANKIVAMIQSDIDKIIERCMWNEKLSPQEKKELIPYIRKQVTEKIFIRSIQEVRKKEKNIMHSSSSISSNSSGEVL